MIDFGAELLTGTHWTVAPVTGNRRFSDPTRRVSTADIVKSVKATLKSDFTGAALYSPTGGTRTSTLQLVYCPIPLCTSVSDPVAIDLTCAILHDAQVQ